MDHRLRLPLFYLGIAALVFTCEPVRASDDTSLLTQLLRKANVVLDNIIAKQTVLDKSKQDVELELIERNEEHDGLQREQRWGADFLALICKELQAHGLYDPSCEAIGEVDTPKAERNYNDDTEKEKGLDRIAKSHVNVISEICALFRKHGIIVDECQFSEDLPMAERSVHSAENEVQQQKEVSEPEPAPKSVESSNSAVGDLSLEKVLKYLQYLRSNSKTKRSRE